MENERLKFFWKNPTKIILRLFLSVVALCLLLTYGPKWFNVVTGILLLGFFIVMVKRCNNKDEESVKEDESSDIYDFEKMYAKYGDLISRKIDEFGVDETHIHLDWFQSFYVYFQKATRLYKRGRFTDFHIAACIIFSAVFYTDDIEYTEIIYRCVRELIAKPRVYIRHIVNDNVIALEVEKTLPEVDLAQIEETIAPSEIAKIIKEMYIKNKTGKALIELADFLNRIYLSST